MVMVEPWSEAELRREGVERRSQGSGGWAWVQEMGMAAKVRCQAIAAGAQAKPGTWEQRSRSNGLSENLLAGRVEGIA